MTLKIHISIHFKIAFSNQLHYVTGLRDRNETGM